MKSEIAFTLMALMATGCATTSEVTRLRHALVAQYALMEFLVVATRLKLTDEERGDLLGDEYTRLSSKLKQARKALEGK